MTAFQGPGREAARVSGPPAAAAGAIRLTIYAAALGVAYALTLLVQGAGQGRLFWAAALPAGGALATGIRGFGPPFRAGVYGCLAVALALPVVPEWWRTASSGPLMEALPLWPQILVALFASRVLAEDCDLRYARFWQAPLTGDTSVQLQSSGAAVALGACLTFSFYQLLWWAVPDRFTGSAMSAIVVNALAGQTPVHRGIVFLFFVVIAFAVDAVVHDRQDRIALRTFQASMLRSGQAGAPPDRRRLGAVLAELARDAPHTRTVRLLLDAYDALDPEAAGDRLLAATAFGAFQLASRRFVRGLLPFLPLLGFFGTVVGLATAMAALPTNAGAGGTIDISGSLSGLAVKFETTLLGIMASMVASFVLSVIERRETDLAAACSLVVGAVDGSRAP